MPNIRPVSDLRNYKSVLDDVSYGSPVYLTKNGRGDCAIIDMKELDELNAMKALIQELGKGEASATNLLLFFTSRIFGRRAVLLSNY